MSIYPKHNKDFYGWALHTAQLIKDKKMDQIDTDSLIEELEDMGGSNENQLINRFAILIAHLLKWEYQPTIRSRSWEATIEEQRNKINRLIRKNPSLKPKILEAIEEGFLDSRSIIKKDTPLDLSILPKICPYTFDQLVSDLFYPQ